MELQDHIQQARCIVLDLPPHPTEKDFHTALLLYQILHKSGKEVEIRGLETASKKSEALSSADLRKERAFAVSIKGIAPWISRVSYEKDDADISLYFSLKQGSGLRQPPVEPGLTLIVDNRAVQDNRSTLPPSFLPPISLETLKGLDLSLVTARSGPVTRLIAKSLQTLEYVEKLRLFVILLTKNDLEACGAKTVFFKDVFQELKAALGDNHSYLILFEDFNTQKSRGLFWSPNQELQDKLMLYGNGEGKGNWVLFSVPDKSLQTIKTDAINLLQP